MAAAYAISRDNFMADDFATKDHVKAELLESERQEREISDDKYAPMIVKTIVFGIVGAIALGVVMGIVNIFVGRTIDAIDRTTQPTQIFETQPTQ